MMGSTNSPEDGGAVAASIFIAVAVYAVSAMNVVGRQYSDMETGLLGVLRFSSSTAHQTESERNNFIELTQVSGDDVCKRWFIHKHPMIEGVRGLGASMLHVHVSSECWFPSTSSALDNHGRCLFRRPNGYASLNAIDLYNNIGFRPTKYDNAAEA